jgi:hypothetical protein
MVHLEKSWLPPIAGKRSSFHQHFIINFHNSSTKKDLKLFTKDMPILFDLDSEQPDVVVYDRKSGIGPALLIEF